MDEIEGALLAEIIRDRAFRHVARAEFLRSPMLVPRGAGIMVASR